MNLLLILVPIGLPSCTHQQLSIVHITIKNLYFILKKEKKSLKCVYLS